jgi:tetratricopeptide (TPR) repeat protein
MKNILFLILALSVSAQAQHAIIREVNRPMTTYPYSDPDPVARPGRIYPYFRFDGLTNQSKVQNWKMVEMENDYIQLAIMPEVGGKVWEAIEKSEHYPFVFSTQAVKFRDIGLRGPWTTGGLEFNFGDIGHATTASTPVDYYSRTNPDGSVSCFIGATEWASRTTWRIEIKLTQGNAWFTTNAWWYNNTPVEQEFYHWVNGGFKADGNLEFIFPGTHYIGHVGEHDTWPLDSMGRQISFYEYNNFGSYKSYHVLGRSTHFYGAYWHQDDMGFGHYSPYYEKLGKKVWILGLSQEGTRWEYLLTDGEGLNVELQSGRLFNQASPGSMFTPFKHVAFAPYAADSWSEYWFPIKHTRGLTHASSLGALNLRAEDGWLKVDWMPLENQSDTLKVLKSGSPVLTRKFTLKPLQVIRDSVRWQGSVNELEVRVGQELLTDDPGPALNRPLRSPDDFDWESEYGLLLRGKDLSNQKDYGEAEKYLLLALEKNPNLVPALTQMAQIRYRQGLYDKARDYSSRALSINTYDGEANYFWGLSNEQLGNTADALDGYSVAVLTSGYRKAAYLHIAYLAMHRKDWKEAEVLISKCLQADPPNEHAWNVKAVICRKQGKTEEALRYLNEQLSFNPLNHLARFEKYLITKLDADRNEFVGLIRQELPHETYIEMAIHYYQWNMTEEALRMLELAPAHPIVRVWQAYLLDKTGRRNAADGMLEQALAASPELVFPFRPEMIEVFIWANQRKPDWKWSYYEALIRWQHNQVELAKSLFNKCGTEPDFIPFYLTKAELFRDEPSIAGLALERAYQLDPLYWRTGLKLAQYYSIENQKDKALFVAEKNNKTHRNNSLVGLQYAHMLRLNGRFSDALGVLNKLNMLPAEGDVDAHSLFRESNILSALQLMKKEDWKKAVTYLLKAETWPENLFTGEPYLPDNRTTQFLISYCYEKLKNQSLVNKSFTYIRNYKNPDGWSSSLGNKLTKLIIEGKRDYKTITGLLIEDTVQDRDKDVLKVFFAIL